MDQMIDFDIPGPIGIQDIEVEQGLTRINTNRTLLVCSLQKNGPYEPELIPDHNTKSLTRLFEHGKPEVDVQLETGEEEESLVWENIKYTSLREFRPEEIAKRLPLLQRLTEREKQHQRIVDEIERSKKLQDIITDESKRTAFLDLLLSIREELENDSIS